MQRRHASGGGGRALANLTFGLPFWVVARTVKTVGILALFFWLLMQEMRTLAEFIGLPAFVMRSIFNSVYPDQNKGKDVYLQGSRQKKKVRH